MEMEKKNAIPASRFVIVEEFLRNEVSNTSPSLPIPSHPFLPHSFPMDRHSIQAGTKFDPKSNFDFLLAVLGGTRRLRSAKPGTKRAPSTNPLRQTPSPHLPPTSSVVRHPHSSRGPTRSFALDRLHSGLDGRRVSAGRTGNRCLYVGREKRERRGLLSFLLRRRRRFGRGFPR